MNTESEMLFLMVKWACPTSDTPEIDDADGDGNFHIPTMPDDEVKSYLEKTYNCAVEWWDHIEECGSCGNYWGKKMWDCGKVDCCRHCDGCDKDVFDEEGWAEDATWGASGSGDLCPSCVGFYLKCEYCNSCGVDKKDDCGLWIHAECAASAE
jgi:hypothetical protein